jgi:hypothetical protein
VSIQAMNWARGVPGLAMAPKFALVMLANYADDCGVCWPEQETLAQDCACSERTIRSALSALEDAGLIARQARRRKDGSRRSDVFLLVGFAARRAIAKAEDHPILTPADVADMTDPDRINRQNLPVADGDLAGDQPADFSEATGKICTTNRQDLPVTIRQEPSEEPSREPSKEEEGAQARAKSSDLAGGKPQPPASGLSALLHRVIAAVNHDPASPDLPHWWQGHGALTSVERWRNFGLSDDQIVACAVETRKGGTRPPPDGPIALDDAMQRFANNLAKRAGKPAVMAPEQIEAATLARLATYVDWIENRPALAANNIRLDAADEMMRRGMTTPDKLRRARVPFRTGADSVATRLFPDWRS